MTAEQEPLVLVPWTEKQVAALERRQAGPTMHPYTCGYDQHSDQPLVPTTDGWRCPIPGCPYKQDWAHAADVAGS